MRSTILAAILLTFLVPGSAVAADGSVDADDADITTTRDLFDLCAAAPSDPLALEGAYLCVGFVAGVINYHEAVTTPESVRVSCAPPGTTRKQFIDLYVAWGKANEDNSELMNELAVRGLGRVARETWPCE